jgi:ADP-ribose pyrophosphatase
MMSRAWTDLHSQTLLETRVFSVRKLSRQSPRDGKSHEFWVIDPPDWVNVVALTQAGELVLVEQWRHGTREVTLEVPGGMVDPGEDLESAARRELLEETGYHAEHLQRLGTVEPNPAIQSNRCTTFFAKDCRKIAETKFDTTEECVLQLVPAQDASRLVREGVISHAIVLAALSHAWVRGLIPL